MSSVPLADRTRSTGQVRTCVQAFPVETARNRRDEILREFFSERELNEALSASAQSLAGRVAAKRAVAGLLSTGSGAVTESRIELGHQENGAPVVVGIKGVEADVPHRIKISITHTSDTARAVAVMREVAA